MIKYLVITIFILLLFGCRTNKLYKEVVINTNQYNLSNDSNKIFLGRKFKPAKYVFDQIGTKIQEDFILIFSWSDSAPYIESLEFSALVADNQKEFYFSNKRERHKEIIMSERTEGFEIEKFILKNYLSAGASYLKGIENKLPLSGRFGTDYYVIDNINKKSYVFKNLVIDRNGNPVKW